MDLRTKLIFAFVATSLASMLVLGTFSFNEAAAMLRNATARQLDAMAEARAEDLAAIIEAVREEVLLIQSRTNLRQQMDRYPESPQAAREVIQRIIADAEESVDLVTRIDVFDLDGQLVARAGRDPTGDRLLGTVDRGGGSVTRYFERPDRTVDVVLEAPLEIEGRTVGRMASEVAVGDLVDIAGNFEGLGETGETLLPVELVPGYVTFLNPLRHLEADSLVAIPLPEASLPVRMALDGESGLVQDVPDYRGVPVWAAVRIVPGLPGGLVVKVDAAEELAPVDELRSRLIRVGLSVAALAILGGALVGALLARPIRDLRAVVQGIRDGDSDLRADMSGEDEVSFLAESFNKLMDDVHGPTPGGPPREGES